MNVAVVGAGIMGASTALALTDRGHHVTLYDRYPPGHRQGSSHGRSRIVRAAYPDPFFTGIMVEAYPLWHGLDQRLREHRIVERILHEVGLIVIGRPSEPMVADTVASLTELGVAHEVIEGPAARARWSMEVADDEVAVLTPEAGWVDAGAATVGTIDLAMEQGATLVQEAADPRTLVDRFDRVIACMGAWALAMFGVDAFVTCQTVAHVELGKPWHGPVYIEDTPDFVYGFPSEPGTTTVKIGVHTPGLPIDPTLDERPPSEEMLARIERFATERFGISQPKITEVVTCLYTNTSDEDFRWGEADGVLWASPCSGHGFKFGPWIGQRMADFAEGKRSMTEWPRFSRTA